jgi:hypothetical protein
MFPGILAPGQPAGAKWTTKDTKSTKEWGTRGKDHEGVE